jgi:hypothetical protein
MFDFLKTIKNKMANAFDGVETKEKLVNENAVTLSGMQALASRFNQRAEFEAEENIKMQKWIRDLKKEGGGR